MPHSWGVAKSSSAPSVLSSQPEDENTPSCIGLGIGRSQSVPTIQRNIKNISLPRKRSAPSLESLNEFSVYDKPYIGQHQQGIQFVHPLKRMKL